MNFKFSDEIKLFTSKVLKADSEKTIRSEKNEDGPNYEVTDNIVSNPSKQTSFIFIIKPFSHFIFA